MAGGARGAEVGSGNEYSKFTERKNVVQVIYHIES